MLMLLAPVAVGLLGVAAKAAKHWRAGTEIRNNDTAIIKMMPLEKEWEVIETSANANEVRATMQKGITRYELAEVALQQQGAMK